MSTMKKTSSGPRRIARTSSSTRPPTDFIALGGKPKAERGQDNGSHFRSSTVATLPATKRGKTIVSPSHSISHNRMSPTIPEPLAPCLDCPPSDLVEKVNKNIGHPNQVEGYLCGAIKNLRINRGKPDMVLMLSLMCLAKQRCDIFNNEFVVDSLVSLLRKDQTTDYKFKNNPTVAILACNILMTVFEESENWPTVLMQVFLEDSLGDRMWVDHPRCSEFVINLTAVFNTRRAAEDDGDNNCYENSFSRYELNHDNVHSTLISIMKDRLSRRQTDQSGSSNVGRNMIKTLMNSCGVQEVRKMAVQKLEIWLQNPKLMKHAQELLLSICLNCCTHSQDDVDVIGLLTKMRLKSKPLLSHYLLCIKELIDSHPDNLKTQCSYVLFNELSATRNPINMAVIVAVLQYYPEQGAKTLASVCQDLLLQKDDYLRAVRALMREIVRAVKHNIEFTVFAQALMQEPDMEKYSLLDQLQKDRFVYSTCDLICLTMLLTFTPQLKEAQAVISGKKKAGESPMRNEEIIDFRLNIARIQHDALWWFHVVVLNLQSRISSQDFVQIIYKLMFMKPPDTYHTRDNWPPDNERATLVKMCHDVPVLEDSIMRVAAIGLSGDHPLPPSEALDIIGQLVRRAGMLTDDGALEVSRSELIDTLLLLSQYHHPDNIHLPPSYIPPSLAICQHYWNAVQFILILIAFNPKTLGHQAWTQYPMLKVLMEMMIVNRFVYPPVTIVDEHLRAQMIAKEHQMAAVEKSEVLEFESHLAAATTKLVVTEQTSLLLTQLIAMDPQGHPRRPPDRVLEHIEALSSKLKLGALLCRSREPDFLLDIINRHDDKQAMNWLPDLVTSTKGDINLLPVQCLCEFLLVQNNNQDEEIQTRELVDQLRKIIEGENEQETQQVLKYFFKRLSSPQKNIREKSQNSLKLLLQDENDGTDWLSSNVLKANKSFVVEFIRESITVESNPLMVALYVNFLANQHEAVSADQDSLSKIVVTFAGLLIDRKTIIDAILKQNNVKFITSLLTVMTSYINADRDPRLNGKGEIPLDNPQNQVLVEWKHRSLVFNIIVPQSSVLLLVFAGNLFEDKLFLESTEGSEFKQVYKNLLEMWVDKNGCIVPKVYLVETREEAILIPDWLKLRMLKLTNHDPITSRLTYASIRNLSTEQLILFLQSFGIPVSSMDLLLQIIDSQCELDPTSFLEQSETNHDYLLKLVNILNTKGCKFGQKFKSLLESKLDRPSVIKSVPSCVIDLLDDSSSEEMIVDAPSSDEKITSNIRFLKAFFKSLFSKQDFKIKSWRKLLQAVNQIDILQNVLKIFENDDFIELLLKFSSRTCCLLRAINSAVCSIKQNKKLFDQFNQLISRIKKHLLNSTNPLHCFISSWQQAHASASTDSSSLTPCWSKKLESFLRNQLAYLDNDEEIKSKVGIVAQILLEEIGHRSVLVSKGKTTNNDVCFTSVATTGLLTDWLQVLDPELLVHSPELQRKLLFNNSKLDVKFSSISNRCYLLSLLVEHCCWETLHNSIEWLLSSDESVEKIEASTVLDFLCVVIQNPKIWQGRENKNTSLKEVVLQLNHHQFSRLLIFLVQATAYQKVNKLRFDGVVYLDLFSVYFSKFGQDKLSNIDIGKTILFVFKQMKNSNFHEIWSNIFAQLYILKPYALIWDELFLKSHTAHDEMMLRIEEKQKFSLIVFVARVGSNCVTDSFISSLFNRLGYVKSKSKIVSTMALSNLDTAYDANLILTKLAMSRPFLVLRQIPLLASMLKGRTRHDFTEFKVQHHLPLMLNSVVLMSMLVPYLFAHTDHVRVIIDIFWQMIRNYCHRARRQMITVFHKTLLLSHQYLNHDPLNAVPLLNKYSNAMLQLSSTYNDVEYLIQLLNPLIAMTTSRVIRSPLVTDKGISKSLLYSQFLKQDQDLENILQVLLEFDESSRRKVDDLSPYVDDLCALVRNNIDPEVRRSGITALLRHFRTNPDLASLKLLPIFIPTNVQANSKAIDMLQISDDVTNPVLNDDIVTSSDTVTFLPDVTILCRENSIQLLGSTFDCGIKSTFGNENLCDIIAKSLCLLRGLGDADVSPKSM